MNNSRLLPWQGKKIDEANAREEECGEFPKFVAGAGDEIPTHDSLLGKHGLGAPEPPMMHAEQLLEMLPFGHNPSGVPKIDNVVGWKVTYLREAVRSAFFIAQHFHLSFIMPFTHVVYP